MNSIAKHLGDAKMPLNQGKKPNSVITPRLSGSQKVTGSSPVSSTRHKPLPNHDLRYLPTVGSAAFPKMPNR